MLHVKSLWQTCAGALLLAVLAGTAQADTRHEEFSRAWQKWQAAGLHDYAFTLKQSCFCIGMQPLRITVRGDAVQSAVTASDGAAVKPEERGKLLDMNQIFQKIEAAYAQPADHITLTLNQEWGYPERVYVDYYVMMADEELIYEISDFAH
jgi:hypothetical protein